MEVWWHAAPGRSRVESTPPEFDEAEARDLNQATGKSVVLLSVHKVRCVAAQAVRVEKMALQQGEDGRMVARGTGDFDAIPADLVLVSIGYCSVAIEGAGFDPARGIVLNRCRCRSHSKCLGT